MKLFNPQPDLDTVNIRSVLERFRDEVCECLGADLKSMTVYGDYIRNQAIGNQLNHVNVMLVLDQTDAKTLDKVAGPTARAASKTPFSVMVLTQPDLQSSCDVFPVKFQEMKLYYRVLAGEDVLVDLVISDEHLRLRCEQRLKNLLLRLRSAYLQNNAGDKQLQAVLVDARDHLIRDMGACLMVKCGIQPEDSGDVADAFADEFGIGVEVIAGIESLQNRAAPTDAEEVKATYDGFMRLVGEASDAMDKLELEQ